MSIESFAVSIIRLKYPSLQKRGFKNAVSGLLQKQNGGIKDDDILIPFIPDAYVIDEDKPLITMFEVEDSHKIKKNKLVDIANFWFYMECKGVPVRLICKDRYGNNPSEVNLARAYFHLNLGDGAFD